MSTTNLFVELIVIGVGAITWLALLVLAVFGYKPVNLEFLASSTFFIPALAFTYLLGIVTDRFADTFFERSWLSKTRRELFPDRTEYHNARTEILLSSPALSDLIEYSRSRMRICRGWSFNAFLSMIALNIFVWTRGISETWGLQLELFGTFAFLALSYACWYAWSRISRTELLKIKEQHSYLQTRSRSSQSS